MGPREGCVTGRGRGFTERRGVELGRTCLKKTLLVLSAVLECGKIRRVVARKGHFNKTKEWLQNVGGQNIDSTN